MKKWYLRISVTANVFLLIFFVLCIFKVGGISYIKEKLYYMNSVPIVGDIYGTKASLFDTYKSDNSSIVMLGDSLTAIPNWNELLNDDAVVNRGIEGDMTTDVLNRIDNISDMRPQKVFIMIGINDLTAGLSVDDVISNYEKVIKAITSKSPDTKVYIQSLLPINTQMYYTKLTNTTIEQVNAEVKKIADKYGSVYVDLYSLFLVDDQLNQEFTVDGIHLTAKGYLRWKDSINDSVG